jgi:DNA-binding NtrC family response regulator
LSAAVLWQALGALRTMVRRAAETDLAVLIAGGSGQSAGGAAVGADAVASPLAPQADSDSPGQTLAAATARFQAQYIARSIQEAAGNMSRAASRLGLNRSNLYRKMRQLGMALPEGGAGGD